MIRRRSRAAIAVLVLAAAAVLTPSPASATTYTSLIFYGHGKGHGHGMSQYGANGAAAAGHSYPWIVGFYYPGTAWGTKSGDIKVQLSEITNSRLVVKSRSNLTASWAGHTAVWNLGKLQPTADAWQIAPASGGRSQLLSHSSGYWTTQAVVTGTYLQFRAGGAPIQTQVPGGYRSYSGTVAAMPTSPGSTTRDIVDRVALEDYVRGVVPMEMPATWQPEALKAQAVAARTYAAYEMAHPLSPNFHVYDDTRSQVFGGFSAQVASSNAAVSLTAGRILTYGGVAAFTQFSSSNGGYELAGSAPYLVTRADPNDPQRPWNADGSASTRSAARTLTLCAGSGTQLTSLSVTYVPDAGQWVQSVTVGWPGGSCTVTGAQFRVGLGLPSANFAVSLS